MLRQLLEGGRGLLRGTPRRTFVLYPAIVLAYGMMWHKRLAPRQPATLLLLPWGYLQYSLVGKYRQRQRAGPRGYAAPPDRLITEGPYALTRNPMYLGHLLFLLGLAASWRSRPGWLILLFCLPWFHRRVVKDEERLQEKFGAVYSEYSRRVKRWIPFIL